VFDVVMERELRVVCECDLCGVNVLKDVLNSGSDNGNVDCE
jgi:hypothetical protein